MKIENIINKNPHLMKYLIDFKRDTGTIPVFYEKLSIFNISDEEFKTPNLIYPVADDIFIHIFLHKKKIKKYHAIEPELTQYEQKKFKKIMGLILDDSVNEPIPNNDEELYKLIDKLLRKNTTFSTEKNIFKIKKVVSVTKNEFKKSKYTLKRNITGNGKLEPLMMDEYIEDIHCVGSRNISIIHKIFGMLETNIRFSSDVSLLQYLASAGDKSGSGMSEGNPIVDVTMKDGSRMNVVFSNVISRRGPSFTVRKFTKLPFSISELIKLGTINSEIAAYIWLCIQNGMSMFICGETASGKTSLLNSFLSFIDSEAKVFTAEETPEIRAPQKVWQQLLTRTGIDTSEVSMYKLLRTALRSRPDYIIVGEIRGKEATTAFHGIQTGHIVLSTIHASSVKTMIQRLTGKPISVPLTFIDNLNISLFMQASYKNGKLIRRCTNIEEIEGYVKEYNGIATRNIFQLNTIKDKHIFRGMNNSYMLETKVASKMGYKNKRDIYTEMFKRAEILDEIVSRKIFNYFEVNDLIQSYMKKGLSGLPFSVKLYMMK